MAVVSIRNVANAAPGKAVGATQKAIDALPPNSGDWSVEGVPGLYVRCRAQSKTFRLERRVDGALVKKTLAAGTVKQAKAAAMSEWTRMKPRPAAAGVLTLEMAIEQFLERERKRGPLAEKTKEIARYNADRYLDRWKARSLEDIGKDRAGIRLLQHQITVNHGKATANQVMRLLAAAYRWHQDANAHLTEWPRKVALIHDIEPRDWAYSPEELRAWWSATVEKKNKKGEKELVAQGVTTLGPIKRMWWLTALFTGARKGSIEALKWPDVDLDKKVIRFRVTKGDRPYSIPIADKLAELLTAYRASGKVPPSAWVFPSNVIEGSHIVDVKNTYEGVGPAHRLRHTYRTTLAELGASPDQARMLMGHSMGGDVSRGYITSSLVVESLRPIANGVAQHYAKIIPEIVG